MPLLNKRKTSPNKAMPKKGEIPMFATCNIILTNLRDCNHPSSILMHHRIEVSTDVNPSIVLPSWQIGNSIESYEMISDESVFGICKSVS